MTKKYDFEKRNRSMINSMNKDPVLKENSKNWLLNSYKYEYSYHFTWLGRSIIQYPQDMIAMQEIIWKVKPDLIIETGVAHGGSIIFSASMLELIGKGEVIGIDIDVRKHNRKAIEKHPLFHRITLLEGSSTDSKVVKKVNKIAENHKKVLVILDSNHTHHHVLKEMNSYSKLVTKRSYMVVFDTIIEDMDDNFFKNRPWGKGNNAKTAVIEFLKKNKLFQIDYQIEKKLLITDAPSGFLKRIR